MFSVVFRGRPAACTLAGVVCSTTRQHVASAVEMHDLFQALEMAVMAIGLHKVRARPLVDVAQRGHLKASAILRDQRSPPRIDCGRLSGCPLGRKPPTPSSMNEAPLLLAT